MNKARITNLPGRPVQRIRIKVKHALDAGVHLLFLDKLAALCRRESL
jgi:hypothetical protein